MARRDPRRAARRLRGIGAAVLLAGAIGAGAAYWIGTHRSDPSLEELLPGSTAARARQMGLLYGPAVESMWELYQDMKEPAGQAVTIAALSAIAAAGCFRAAWLREHV